VLSEIDVICPNCNTKRLASSEAKSVMCKVCWKNFDVNLGPLFDQKGEK